MMATDETFCIVEFDDGLWLLAYPRFFSFGGLKPHKHWDKLELVKIAEFLGFKHNKSSKRKSPVAYPSRDVFSLQKALKIHPSKANMYFEVHFDLLPYAWRKRWLGIILYHPTLWSISPIKYAKRGSAGTFWPG